jgi:hypothetical protein
MRTLLEKAHSLSSIGTFVLTIVIVVLMVIPLLWPSGVFAVPPGRVIGWVLPAILAFCFILGGALNFLAARTRHEPSPDRAQVPLHTRPAPLQPRPALVPNRVPTNATPAELANIWEQHTAVQAKKLSECYLGTWMEISGSVFNVREDANDVAVSVDNVPGVLLVRCEFPKELEQRCSVLRKGDAVNVLGKVSDFDARIVTLKECEFI